MTAEEIKAAWEAAVEAASNAYDADIYFYSGSIDDDGFGKITRTVTEHAQRDHAILILVTNGGLANPAFQIARLFQNTYQRFSVFCPSRCKSAGTLLALGANTLIMDTFSELGPLDVQLVKQNEIFARKSGLLAKSSFDALADASFEVYERLMINISVKSRGNVSFKLASELSATMASTMMTPVYAQINPEIVGAENRDLDIAYAYGTRLTAVSGNAGVETVFNLIHGYPSHDFIIDAKEAGELFNNVEQPREELYQILAALSEAAYGEASPSIVAALTRKVVLEASDGEQPAQEGGEEDVARQEVDGDRDTDRGSDPEAANEDVPSVDDQPKKTKQG